MRPNPAAQPVPDNAAARRAAARTLAWTGAGTALAAASAAWSLPALAAWVEACALGTGFWLVARPRLAPFIPAIEAVDVGQALQRFALPLTYTPRAYLGEALVRASGLPLPPCEVFGGGHLIEGELDGRRVRISKLRLAKGVPTDLPLPRYRAVFHGLFYAIALDAPAAGPLVAVPHGAEAPAWPRLRTGDHAFDAVYAVHALDPASVPALLTPAMRTGLLALILAADAPPSVAFNGDHAYVAVPRAAALLESVLVRAESDPPAADLVAAELRMLLRLPATLGLGAVPAALA